MDDASEDYETEGSETGENQDRLSELPLSLIFHVLSFLPMIDVVWTTILSKRWKDLWTTVPCLYFCDKVDDVEVDVERKFRNFINGALLFWRGAKILKFEIDLENFSMSLAKDIDLWVIFAKKYKVEELNIDLRYLEDTFDWDNAVEGSKRDIYIAPQCLNSCSSIKALSLVGYNLRIPEPPLWNQLKSLRIDGFCLSECLINRVLSGTPKLEVFNLRLLESNENLSIQSRSLKRLKIEKYLYFHYDKPSTTSVLRIECPNLEVFEILGLLYSKCVLINVSSLTDVTLGFQFSFQYDNDGLSGEQLLGETLRQIVPIIHNVKRITLSEWCVQVLEAIRSKYLLSPLSNVEFLNLTVGVIELDKLVDLLGSFSELKILAIKHLGYKFTGQQQYVMEQNAGENDLEPESNIPISFLLQLRTFEITSIFFKPLSPMFPFIEFVLKHAGMLEKIAIRAVGSTPESLLAATEKLLSMPRSSPTAKVIFLRK